MPPSRHSDEQKAEAVRMYQADCGPGPAAKKFKVSPSTVTRWAQAAGIGSVAIGPIRVANETRSERLRARRQELADLLLEDAHRMRKQLWEPYTEAFIGGKDNTLTTYDRDEPSFSDKRAIMSTVSTAVTSIAKLDAFDKDTSGMDAALSIVDKLIDGFGVSDDVDDSEDNAYGGEEFDPEEGEDSDI